MKIYSLIGILLIGLFVIAGCNSNTGQTATNNEKVYRVGVVAPLTGEGAVYGLPVQRVIQQAINDLNDQWASKNQRLEVYYEDGKCNGKDALTAAQSLVRFQNVKAIIGGMCSGETLGIAPFAEENKILVFSPLSSSPEVTHAGDFIFRNYPSDVAQVDKAIPFMQTQGYKKVAIISENTDYAQALRAGYLEKLPLKGMEVVADEVISPGAKDIRTEVAKIKSANPDVVLVLPQTIPMAGTFAKQIYEANVDVDKIGNDVVALEQTINEYPKELEGYYSPSSVFEKENSPEFALVKSQTDCELGYYCATTYDSIFLMGEILEKCGDKDAECMKDQFYATQNWEGKLSGATSFDSNGDRPGNFQINKGVNGVWVKA